MWDAAHISGVCAPLATTHTFTMAASLSDRQKLPADNKRAAVLVCGNH